jgi:hypothetical protein
MADGDKIGKPWDDDELDAIVADYFAMLDSEILRRPYVKSRHSAALMARIGRTHRSVEFKHQNVSAVLDELGLPWIRGYQPKRNYQGAIFDAIDRYLSTHPAALNPPAPADFLLPKPENVFVDPPKLKATAPSPERLRRLVQKFDPVERDEQNRTLGRAGERLVFDIERRTLETCQRPDLARKVRWISQEIGDGAGYDILSFDPTGQELLIEVKTTNGGPQTPFFISRNEFRVAAEQADAWRLYRVHLFVQAPRIFALAPPLAASVHLRAEVWRASFV